MFQNNKEGNPYVPIIKPTSRNFSSSIQSQQSSHNTMLNTQQHVFLNGVRLLLYLNTQQEIQ